MAHSARPPAQTTTGMAQTAPVAPSQVQRAIQPDSMSTGQTGQVLGNIHSDAQPAQQAQPPAGKMQTSATVATPTSFVSQAQATQPSVPTSPTSPSDIKRAVQRAEQPAQGGATNIDDRTWTRLERVKRGYEAKRATGDTGGVKKLPSFMSAEEKAQAIQRRERREANKQMMRQAHAPRKLTAAQMKKIQRRKSQLVVPSEKLHSQTRPDPTNPSDNPAPTAPTAEKQANDINTPKPAQTAPPAEAPASDTGLTKLTKLTGQTASLMRQTDPSTETSLPSPAPMTLMREAGLQADEQARLGNLLSNVAPAQNTDSSIPLVTPAKPRPRVQRQKQATPPPSPPSAPSADSGDAPAPEIYPVETEIGALPSDLWNWMGETPPAQGAQTETPNTAVQRTSQPANQPRQTATPPVQRQDDDEKKKRA